MSKRAAPFSSYLKAERALADGAIARLYGKLPSWLPEPAMLRIQQALSTLWNAGQSNERIVELVAQAHNDTLVIPGTALDVHDFIKSANYLAHVKWALSHDKLRAIKELAGRDAELGQRIRTHRRTYSHLGNAAKKQTATKKAQNWLAIGKPLRDRHPTKSNSWLAGEIARNCGDKVSSIRAAVSRLGLQKKRT